MTNEEAKVFLDNLKICIDEHPIVADWLVEIADRQTENSSEKPNNCEPKKWTKENCKGCKYNEYPYDSGTCFVRVCINGNKYEPKDEPQTGVSYSDHTDYDEPKTYVTWTEPRTEREGE